MKLDHKAIRIGFLLLALGFLIGLWADTLNPWVVCSKEKYEFISKSAACGDKEVVDKSAYVAFRDTLIAYIESEKRAGKVDEVAYYFRDLIDGPVFGINEYGDFVPASLLKLPLALAYLSIEENNPGTLDKKLAYESNSAIPGQVHAPANPLQDGESYTVEELIYHMLAYSDNPSAYLLFENLDKISGSSDTFLHTYRELGITNPNDPLSENLTVRGYASIYRLLYNASYLNVELSDKVLEWLSESQFTEGIVAGVPEGTKAAHKFGERIIVDASGRAVRGGKQLHDCGIIYYPGNPYVLCIMTKGNEWGEMKHVISEMSRLTYKEVNSRRRNSSE